MHKVKINRLVNIPGVGACAAKSTVACTDAVARVLVQTKGFGEYVGKLFKIQAEEEAKTEALASEKSHRVSCYR